MQNRTELPKPEFNIGDEVCWKKGTGNRRYYEKCYLRHLIKSHREYAKPGRLSDHVKNMIRAEFDVVRKAEFAEIIGIVPFGMYCKDSVQFNECYLADIPGVSSGIFYTYQLCIRFTKEDETPGIGPGDPMPEQKRRKTKHLALFTGIPVASERDLMIIAREK